MFFRRISKCITENTIILISIMQFFSHIAIVGCSKTAAVKYLPAVSGTKLK
jgi:hypothetical protein